MIIIPQRSLTDPLVARCRWYVFVRWFVVVSFALLGLTSSLADQTFYNNIFRDTLFSVGVLGSNALFQVLVSRKRSTTYYARLATGFLATDILLITALIYTKGGIESRSILLYVLPILLSAALFHGRAIYRTTVGAIASYSALLIADHLHIVRVKGAVSPQLSADTGYVLNSIVYIGTMLLLIALIADYINRLLVREELKSRHTLMALSRAQEIAHVGSWEYDVATNTTYWSRELYRILHHKNGNGAIKFADLLKHVHPEDRATLNKKYRAALLQPTAFSHDFRLGNPGKQLHYVHSETRSMADAEGNVYRLHGTIHDVTDFKRLDEAKSDFVSLVSHQLRTPATVVKQYIGLLREGYAGTMPTDQQTLVNKAYSGNERQLKIIDELLRIAHLDSGRVRLKKQTVDLVPLLQTLTDEYNASTAEDQEPVEFQTKRKQLLCEIDPEYMRMAVENVIDNATKYAAKSSPILVTLKFSDGKAFVSIRDWGIGIAEEDIKLIFHKFHRVQGRLSAHIGGSGLGLYWVARVMAMHKGKIAVKSKVGKGTTFTLTLPVNSTTRHS